MNKKNKVNELKMDMQTYKKVSGTMNPKDRQDTTITGDKPTPTSPNNTSVTTPSTTSYSSVQSVREDDTIKPQDKATIKYLSNVKDSKTGDVSKPFSIGGKKYQMVRGTNSKNEVVMGVYCHDELNEGGDNIIHSLDYFEKNIAQPMKERMEMVNDKGPAEQGLSTTKNMTVGEGDFEDGPESHQPGDAEYHNPKMNVGEDKLSEIRDIDWKVWHESLVANTEYVKTKHVEGNPQYYPFTISDMADPMDGGMTQTDANLLLDHDIIEEVGHFPILSEPKFITYEIFMQAVVHAYKVGFSEVRGGNDSEEPYLRGREDVQENGFDYAGAETEFHDKEALMAYLNLEGLEGFKHFFVNSDTGEIAAEFRSTKEMINSRRKLRPNEEYMDVKGLKRFRFGEYFTNDVNEDTTIDPTNPNQTTQDGINISKLQSDVKKLTTMIKNKFSIYLAKLNKPIEQAQFLSAMAQEIGVPLNKLTNILNAYKSTLPTDSSVVSTTNTTSNPPVTPAVTYEKKVMTKNALEEKIKGKRIIKRIKVKEI